MRMRILFSWTAVRCPARVANAISAVERFLAQLLLEVAQFALGAANFQLMILVDDGNARRVITAVFKLAQPVDYQRHDLFVSDVSNYSTHKTPGSRQEKLPMPAPFSCS